MAMCQDCFEALNCHADEHDRLKCEVHLRAEIQRLTAQRDSLTERLREIAGYHMGSYAHQAESMRRCAQMALAALSAPPSALAAENGRDA